MNIDYLLIIAVISAYTVKGLCGFANTLVLSTILGFRSNNIEITPLDLIAGYPTNLIIVWKERKSLSMKVWLPLSILVIIGGIPGTFLLKNGDTTILKIVFGIIVVLFGVEMLCREYNSKKRKSSPWELAIIGIISGLFCGLFGVGAFLAAYVSRTTDSSKSFRGNLCLVFSIECTFRLIIYSMTGIITKAIFLQGIKLMPLMLLGLGIGILLSKVLDEKKVKKAIVITLILSGLSLLITNVLKFL